MALQLTFLARVAIESPGASVEVRGPQPAVVLAYLVLERPRPLLRDELIDLLWPGSLPDHWEGAARQVVSRARRALTDVGLPSSALTSTAGNASLHIDEPIEVDVERALARVVEAGQLVADKQWDEATELAQDALASLQRPFLPASECDWAVSWRERIDSFAQRSLHIAAEAALGARRGNDAVELARDALRRDAFDEHATRLLMSAFEMDGNRAGALRAYEQLRRVLDDELGVRPSEETEEAYRLLLGAPPVAPRADARLRTAVRAIETGPFVGRRDELAELARARDRAVAGSCQVVVIEGEAGIGKTRLVLQEAEAGHGEGSLVLWGRCDPDLGVAHGPFADVVAQLLSDRPDVVDTMGVLAGHLAPLVPQLVPDPDDAAPASSAQASARLFRAVGAALGAVADSPLMIVIDDLHWADGDTLALLRHVLPRLADRPCVVALVLRSPTPEVAGTLAELARLAPMTTIPLGGLSVDDVVELLNASRLELSGDAGAVAATLAARTAGNPLYVTQLVQEAQGSGQPLDPGVVPEAVTRLLERRLAALGDELSSIVVLAAVSGPEFDLETIEACAVAPADDVLDRVEELCRRHLLDERGPGRFGFTHELVRDAVLASVGETRRARVHRRLGEALAQAGADPAAVAHHLVAAGPASAADAATWSLAAGRDALARAAWSSARDHFEIAARLATRPDERCDALIGVGRAQRALGDAADARATLDRALALARAHGIGRAIAGATLALVGGGGRGVAVDLDDAARAALLRDGLDGLDDEDLDLRVPILSELALALVLTDAVEERRALCEECVVAARRWDDPRGLATALAARRIALMGPEGTHARVADGRESLTLPRAEVPPELVLAAQLGLVEDLLELGDRAGADRYLDEATRLAAELDHPYWSWAAACWRTLSAIVDGRLDEAEQAAFDAVGRQSGEHPEALAALAVNLVDVRFFQGRAGEVVGVLRAAADTNPHIPCYRAVLALCCAEAGDHDGAREAFDSFAACSFRLPADSNWLLTATVLADVCATLGDDRCAPSLVRMLEPFAGRQAVLNCYGGGGAFWGPVAHHLGRLAAVRGDHDEARRLLGDALVASEAFGAPLFADRTRAALDSLA